MLAALKNGRSATLDGAWGSASALAAAALALHAPTSLVILLAHVGDVDDFRDDVATFAGIVPEVFPAWEKPPRELNAVDEVFGRRMRRAQAAFEQQPAATGGRTLSSDPPAGSEAGNARAMARTVAVGQVVAARSLDRLDARARHVAG